MKVKNYLAFFLLIILFCSFIFIPGDVKATYYDSYMPGEILIKVDTEPVLSGNGTLISSGLTELDEMNKRFSVYSMSPVYQGKSGILSGSSSISMVYKVTFPPEFDVRTAVNAYAGLSGVEYAEPNYIFYGDLIPNDPDFSLQQTYLDTMSVTAGWDITTGNSSIVVAVVDSGVDMDHPDLIANIWSNGGEIPNNGIDDDNNGFIDDAKGWDFVSVGADSVFTGEDPGPRDNNPDDFAGHGTFVSTQVAGAGNNAYGLAGMTWNCKIMPARAGYETPSGGPASFTAADVAAAITYAVDNGARIINMSFGGRGTPDSFPTITQSINDALARGVILFAAAGNSNLSSSDFPGNIDGVISVGSVELDGTKSSFSNYGTDVDIYAMGRSVYGSFPLGPHSQTGATPADTGFTNASGTSFSTPLTAGLAALILSLDPSLNSQEVVNQILNFSDITTAGLPRINVLRSLTEGEFNSRTCTYNLPPGWSFISIPLESVVTINNFSGSFFYDEGKGQVLEITQNQISQLNPGFAYWTLNPTQVVRTATITGVPLRTSQFTRTLSPEGMIPVGNPFTFKSSLPWGSSSVTMSNGLNLSEAETQGVLMSTLYFYNTDSQAFEPLTYNSGNIDNQRGYYMLNRSGESLIFSQ